MSEPTTEAGRALMFGLDRLMPEKHADALAKVAAIEAEARAAVLAELRGQVEGLATRYGYHPEGTPGALIEVLLIDRAAVLALFPDPVTEETPR